MNLIVVVDSRWGIGKDGGLLVHLPGDLKYFKEKTLGKILIMGRETLDSLPGGNPLTGRRSIVLSRNPKFIREGCTVCNSMGSLFNLLESENMNDVFVAGGEEIYKAYSPYCSRWFVTKIFCDFQAEKFFENLDLREDLTIAWESPVQEEKGIRYQFLEYVKK